MTEPLLEVRELNAWYGDSHVLHGVNVAIHKGETVTLLGRNGAGKTTTLKTIMGILRKRKGAIRHEGVDIMGLPSHEVARRGLGYVPEERGIFASLSVMENLMLPPDIAPSAYSVSRLFELFPNLAERKSSQGTKLSGGEQQMLAIARILRAGAQILLLDEPTEGLAPVIVQRIGALLLELKKNGMTVLLVEQNFRFARKFSDRFYLMEDGRIIDGFSASQFDEKMGLLQKTLAL
jgi:branched-chain amino acid transport system ATP-binding protein